MYVVSKFQDQQQKKAPLDNFDDKGSVRLLKEPPISTAGTKPILSVTLVANGHASSHHPCPTRVSSPSNLVIVTACD
ncbi:unnamed protein product [Dibothriocephalus latus]|uniref:Uncharacterized protein n=1 Tax=Dibothriocephalus latus TaxID=60516 RepID=A0A3P7QQ29_DIBLA|nr:unnamed protein product [Dibothriocephalus latus]